MKIIFATHNPGKVIEMKEILSGLDVEVLSADEAGIFEDVVEDGTTLQENALKKAKFVRDKSGHWSLADDTGLFIEALSGAPGVYSARWAKMNGSDDDLAEFALNQLKDIKENERNAYFESCLALVSPSGKEYIFLGRANGSIAFEKRGTPRPKLPYDLIFIPKNYESTFAEMQDEEKNKISHRGLTFEALKNFLKDFKDI